MKKVLLASLLAAVLWFIMFSPWTSIHINFWIAMACSAAFLWAMSAFFDKNFSKQFSFNVKDLVIGLMSAAVLYGVFVVGNYLSTQWFDFAGTQIQGIYGMKEEQNLVLVGVLLTVLIGPAEEIFWRGYVQKQLGARYGDWFAVLITVLIYTLVHIWSFNFMLIMAAMVCGLFWGILYKYHKNIVTLIVSHAVWDVAVFILIPIA
ncbi:MAG: CPBP family intramembrane metalloprotease [Bacteroidales bacterium]|nr:CPBP family intramembrane metalloprotease [Bacteroidales bacterium]